MSQAVIRSMPAPMQAPWTAAMTGNGARSMALKAFCSERIVSRKAYAARPGSFSNSVAMSAKDVRSMPPVKFFPSPEITAQRTVWSRPSSAIRRGRPDQKSGDIALERSGRFMARSATAPRRSTRKKLLSSCAI